MSPQEVLNLPMDPGTNDAGASTIREYLKNLLSELWIKKEGFSGKRPFGNSGWEIELYVPLIKAGVISGSFDEDGYVERADDAAGDAIISVAIESLNIPA
jgi:hypothetical protein